MILISNSYKDPSPGFVSSVTDYLGGQVDGQRLRACASSLKYSAGVSPTGRDIWLTVPDVYQASFDEALPSKFSAMKLRDFINHYGRAMVSNLDGFETVLNTLVLSLSNQATPLAMSDIIQRSSSNANLFGAATLQWLVGNRHSRSNYNDLVLAAVLCRENYANVRQGAALMVGTGYIPDVDYDYPDFTDTAVGFGARHTKWWMGSASWYAVDEVFHKEAYFYSGRFPWWLQVGMMAMDVQRKSLYKSWLKPSPTIEKDPFLKESFYPYYMLEQPSLLSNRVSSLRGSSYLSAADSYFTKNLGLKIGMADILTSGPPPVLPKEVLFRGIDNDQHWEMLVAGCDNLTSLAAPVSPLGLTTSSDTAAKLREFAYGAPVLQDGSLDIKKDDSVYYPKIKIQL